MGFFDSDVKPVRLVQWLDWASGQQNEVFVALPMIQRGSVWKPDQIINLWDSLLQGMPIGSMMATELPEGTLVRRPCMRHSEKVPEGGGLGLIDGQQRTLAILIAWPLAEDMPMDQRIWVDFADEPTQGQLLRLRMTTKNQPFGFQRNEPSRKLSLDERRKANDALEELERDRRIATTDDDSYRKLKVAWPFSHIPGLPVDLKWLIGKWIESKSDIKSWRSLLEEHLQGIEGVKYDGNRSNGAWHRLNVWATLDEASKNRVCERIENLSDGLKRLYNAQMPLIRVDERFYEIKNAGDNDPPLAILFQRIGAGGTPLSDADYIYSVIKHLLPATYDYVEKLYEKINIASLLTATDLVMSAVRLAAATWMPPDGKIVPDMENPSKRDFNRLLQRGDFIKEAFLPLISPGGVIENYFDKIQATLQHGPDNTNGLPKQAFPLLKRPLVQVLLYMAHVGYLKENSGSARRDDVLRLALFWMVAATDTSKASRLAYEVIREAGTSGNDLGRKIHDQMVNGWSAVRLPTPLDIKGRPALAFSLPSEIGKIRGDVRFDANKQGDDIHQTIYSFYRQQWWRSWTHHHPILLWLQREMVAESIDSKSDPMAGNEEDTPYDYDHILPYAHWGNWQGYRKENHPDRLLDYAEDSQLWVVGNSIGNIRVWLSGLNRSDGEVSPRIKLRLNEDGTERMTILKRSAIDDDQIDSWRIASGEDKQEKNWSEVRALAFQQAVEMRAFRLYERLYNELDFSVWYSPLASS